MRGLSFYLYVLPQGDTDIVQIEAPEHRLAVDGTIEAPIAQILPAAPHNTHKRQFVALVTLQVKPVEVGGLKTFGFEPGGIVGQMHPEQAVAIAAHQVGKDINVASLLHGLECGIVELIAACQQAPVDKAAQSHRIVEEHRVVLAMLGQEEGRLLGP